MADLHDSFQRLLQSASQISSLQFARSSPFADAALAPATVFESHLIRDGEPYELSLFSSSFNPAPSAPSGSTQQTQQEQQLLLDRAGTGAASLGGAEDHRWIATKKLGPRRQPVPARASPLRTKPGQDDPERCLKAARRLLEVYPHTEAGEHVAALERQLRGVVESIRDNEVAFRKPPPAKRAAPTAHAASLAALRAQIKQEEMELLALKELKSGLLKEQSALGARDWKDALLPEKPAEKPKPVRQPFRRPVPVPKVAAASTSSSSAAAPTAATQAKARQTPPRPNAIKTTAGKKQPSPLPASPVRNSPAASDSASAATTKTPRKSISRSSLGGAVPPSPSSPARTGASGDAASNGSATPRAAVRSRKSSLGPGVSSPTTVGGGAPKLPTPKKAAAPAAAEGMGKEYLDAVSAKVWAGVGSVLGSQAPTAEDMQGEGFDRTFATIGSILLSSPTDAPGSPGSIASSYLPSGTSGAGNGAPLGQGEIMFSALLALLLGTISGRPLPAGLQSTPDKPLRVILRDAVLPSSLDAAAAGGSAAQRGKKDAMVPMEALKASLGVWAKSRGWSEDAGTKAVYALVAKKVCRIDRRAKEGALVGIC